MVLPVGVTAGFPLMWLYFPRICAVEPRTSVVPCRIRFATHDTEFQPPAPIGHLGIPSDVHFRRFPNGTFATWQLPDNFQHRNQLENSKSSHAPAKTHEFTELLVVASLRVRMYRSNKVCRNLCCICERIDSRSSRCKTQDGHK